ncbi:MAG TPA: prenyltransferase/squalene oxidase repeat-containing protein [Gemmata sp.]|nr:prenyltransferase/squalene oxidase repeat-containing protein [Gemmata sp.]
MSDKPTTPPAEAPAKSPVIRRLESAQETAQERFMKKHLPAWVISGAVNVGLIALLMLIGDRGATAKAPEQVVATSVEKNDDPPEENLTNEDLGLQADLEAALPEITRLAQQTVDSAVTNDNIGQPDAPTLDLNALNVPGLKTDDFANPGVTGDAGNVLPGSNSGAGGALFSAFPGRSGSTKSRLLREGGGNTESERAVALGLLWLSRQQKPDGSWVYDGASKNEVIASTGMALLPFLAAGETHKTGTRYQKTVAAGLNYLIRHCPLTGQNAGRFTGAVTMYAQGIATIALCEAYGMTKDRGLLLGAAQAAINFIQRQQGANGSWGYSVSSPTTGDTSIVGWQVQALEAAMLSKDIVVDQRVVKKAIAFLDLAAAGSRKAMYGYTDNTKGVGPATSLTSVGLLCRYYIDKWGPDNAGMAEGVAGLMAKAPSGTTKQPAKTKPAMDMYFFYYATQVVHFFEGDEWKDWNEGPMGADRTRKGGMRDWLVGIQEKRPGANQGSWGPDDQFIGRNCGRVGTTALSLLTLEVYYRHLPLYKRGQTGAALRALEAR